MESSGSQLGATSSEFTFLPRGARRVVAEAVELHERREDRREAERDEREVQTLDAQRRNADEHTQHEARGDDRGERQGPRPVLVLDEPRREVRARAEEEALPQRQLTGVADDDLQAEHRDDERDRLVEARQADAVAVLEHVQI